MKMFVEPPVIYLHRDVVDFRKSINGLLGVVELRSQNHPKLRCLLINKSNTKDTGYESFLDVCRQESRRRSYTYFFHDISLPVILYCVQNHEDTCSR
jgi:hypothetical protein